MKNFIFIFSVFTIVTIFSFSSCKKDDENEKATIVLNFKGKVGNENLLLRNSKYTTGNNYKVNIETLKFYLSNITLIKEDNSEVLLKDVAFIDFENNHTSNTSNGETIVIETEAGKFKGIKMGFGVDNTVNNSDPSVYKEEEPLSIYQGMHWSWNTGYIFMKLEGKFDADTTANILSQDYLFHTGLNDLYTTATFNKNFQLNGDETKTLNFNIDAAKMFHTANKSIDLYTESFTHTTGNVPLAEKVRDLFIQAISIE
jgi:hypothetical protein